MPLDKQAEIQILAMLEKLQLVANEQIAQKIIETQKLNWAEARVKLYEDETKHQCAELACLRPVTGILIFEHCEEHLGMFEREWFKNGIEAEMQAEMAVGEDELDVLNRWCDSRDKRMGENMFKRSPTMMKRSRENSERLLKEAKAYIADSRKSDRERWKFLPLSFHGDLRRAWAAQLNAVGIRNNDLDD